MPYIPDAIRDTIELPYVRDDGQLTYVICRIAEELLSQKTDYDWANLSYAMISQVIGDIESAKLEFSRRILAAYEDGKLIEHGDVFESIAHLDRRLGAAVAARRTAAQSVRAAEAAS